MPTRTLKPASATMQARAAELREKRAKIKEGGGKQRIQKQHQSGKLTARERIDKLVDHGSFEIGLFAEHRATYFGMADKISPPMASSRDARLSMVVSSTSRARIYGRRRRSRGGALRRIADMMKLSFKTGRPFVFVNDSGGTRVQEGIDSLAGYAGGSAPTYVSGTVRRVPLYADPARRRRVQSRADRLHHPHQTGPHVHHRPQVIKQVTGGTVGGRVGWTRGPNESLPASFTSLPRTTMERSLLPAVSWASCRRTTSRTRRSCPTTWTWKTILH